MRLLLVVGGCSGALESGCLASCEFASVGGEYHRIDEGNVGQQRVVTIDSLIFRCASPPLRFALNRARRGASIFATTTPSGADADDDGGSILVVGGCAAPGAHLADADAVRIADLARIIVECEVSANYRICEEKPRTTHMH